MKLNLKLPSFLGHRLPVQPVPLGTSSAPDVAAEAEEARKIQQSLFPQTFPQLADFNVAGFCRSARAVAGDFYDALSLPDGSVLLAVADVMGKGMSAALFATIFRTLLRANCQWTRRPSDLLDRINRQMFNDLSAAEMFLTAQLAWFDPVGRRLTVASAGHVPMLVGHRLGDAASVSVNSFSPDGLPLGILPRVDFAEVSLPVDPSSCVLLCSDGVMEARNSMGEAFGQTRLESWLRSSIGLAARQMSATLLSELHQFECTLTPHDDQTVLILAGHQQAQPSLDQLTDILSQGLQPRRRTCG